MNKKILILNPLIPFLKNTLKIEDLEKNLTLSLKTRGQKGGQFPPPSNSHVSCPKMTNDTSLESSFVLRLDSANSFSNLQKLKFWFNKIQLYSKNVCKKRP